MSTRKGGILNPFVRYFSAEFPTLKSAFSLYVANRHPLNCLAPPPESTNYWPPNVVLKPRKTCVMLCPVKCCRSVHNVQMWMNVLRTMKDAAIMLFVPTNLVPSTAPVIPDTSVTVSPVQVSHFFLSLCVVHDLPATSLLFKIYTSLTRNLIFYRNYFFLF